VTTVRKLLVANRGEIARRVFRTCRAMGIATVAVHSDPDADAPFVHEADEAVPIGGAAASESYLRGDAIVAAAQLVRADAVHPGYGFLSENAAFARQCADAGLTWIGPPAAAIESMGSKLAARELMIAAGVPVLPAVDVSRAADDRLDELVAGIGRPLIVKASFGGGGRGMRLVRDGDDLVAAVASARREAVAAFGDDTVFAERYVERPRHIEVQVLADAHGTTVHLFERECSIQRRHQKIVEESPSPFVDDRLRAALGDAAVRAAAAVGYVGAGTVEFVVAPDGAFFFLEMNTRLQVEHPVTELVTGLDLVRLQIQVAEGRPLPSDVTSARLHGHAIEARLYAEDPAHDHRPSPGRLHRFGVPASRGVRVDSGVESGSDISAHYDPMIAKVVAVGDDREDARRLLASALRRARLHGVVTNRDLLVAVLEHDEFVRGDIDTAFLDRHPPGDLVRGVEGERDVRSAAIAAAFAARAAATRERTVLRHVPAAFRNNPSQLVERRYDSPIGELTVGLGWGARARVEVDGEPVDVRAAAVTAADGTDVVSLVQGGVRRRFAVATYGDDVYVDGPAGCVVLRALPRFPSSAHALAAGSLVAPMPGTIVRIEAKEGAAVVAGQPLVVIEAMKMEHQIVAPAHGTVASVQVEVGQPVDAGAVLVVLQDVTAGTDGSDA
jgi:acetyl/propionyl-CoA carboxylase alpha subunit